MSLERTLIVSVFFVLLASLLAGAALTYGHAAGKVRTEMHAALSVGRRVAQDAVDNSAGQVDPDRRLARIIGVFNGDRHLRAVLADGSGRVLMQSGLEAPADPAPGIFVNLVSGARETATVALPAGLNAKGRLLLSTDAGNEVSEAWGDMKLDLSILGLFFCLVLGLVVRTLRGALRPLRELCEAFARVGAGDYTARLAWRNASELIAVQDGFNTMTQRLSAMEVQNRVLLTRVHCVQDEERAELARDLHDEVAPFLFAVSADASLIRQCAAARDLSGIEARADCILTSVRHMQKHLRHVLSQLMPEVLLDLGLAGALESLVHFWKSRRPDIEFSLRVDAAALDDRRTAVAFRVVQESLSNAVRHGDPSKVDISVKQDQQACVIEIADNGRGLPAGSEAKGLGLLGMRERVSAIGGHLHVGKGAGSRGVILRAVLAQDTEALAIS